jgi:hypothetical protein
MLLGKRAAENNGLAIEMTESKSMPICVVTINSNLTKY